MPKKPNEIKKQAVGIIVAPAEKITNGKKFDDDIITQVIPKRLKRIEQSAVVIAVI